MTTGIVGPLAYWGKAQPRGDAGPQWHPAPYHGLDVAAVGAAFLESRPRALAALARAAGLPEDLARRWLLFALSIHDIGKFACCFQSKAAPLFRNRDQWGSARRLRADPGHGRVGIALWKGGCSLDGTRRAAFTPLFGGPLKRLPFDRWFCAAAGHHGRPLAVEDATLDGLACQEALDDARTFVEACADLFNPKVPPDVQLRDAAIGRSSWLVAGLTMLCDWIGSNQTWFEYKEPRWTLPDYWAIALQTARQALDRAGLSAPRVAARFTLADALGKGNDGTDDDGTAPDPTPLQRWAAEEASIDGQSLVIIEDLTGAGKTEAGLIVAHRLMTAGAAEGLYWALPTMATADALYRRFARAYRRLFADAGQASLALAHSASAFNEVFAKSLFEPEPEEGGSLRYGRGDEAGAEGEADADADVTASARWLADDRRRTFLADVGVGTIDQALLGVLPSRHQALRLAALSRRALVVDEAHSYDPYMTRLRLGSHTARFFAELTFRTYYAMEGTGSSLSSKMLLSFDDSTIAQMWLKFPMSMEIGSSPRVPV